METSPLAMGRARYRLHPLSPPGEGRGEGIEQVHASHLKIYHYHILELHYVRTIPKIILEHSVSQTQLISLSRVRRFTSSQRPDSAGAYCAHPED